MTEAEQVLRAAARRLRAAGIPDARRDATRLMAHAAGRDLRHGPVPEDIAQIFEAFIDRRCQREPVSHITAYRDFWTARFEVNAAVLDPRPDTETLVAAALEHDFSTLLDLGTGSGAIVLSLLKERTNARGIGTDISEAALAVAQRNATALGVADRVAFRLSDWFADVSERVDLIVSNPPYIAAEEMAGLAPELAYEPRHALTDEGDGLSAYRAIAAKAATHLTPDGWLLCEIGPSQAEAVVKLFENGGFRSISVRPDLDGRNRVVQGQRG